MADTGAFLGAGLLIGVGKGLTDFALEEARSNKQRMLLELEQGFRSQESEKTRTFQAEQSRLQDERAGVREEARERRQTEREAGSIAGVIETEEGAVGYTKGGRRVDLGIQPRAKIGDTKQYQDAEGYYWRQTPAGDVPVKDAQGKHIKGPLAADARRQLPAEVQTAEWLANKRAAAENRKPTDKDYTDAYDTVRQAKTSPTARAQLVTRIYDSMKRDIMDDRNDDQKQAAARKMVDELISETAVPVQRPAVQAPTAPAQPKPIETAPATPPVPSDPKQRKVGQVYTGANGRKAEWTGQGWKPVP